MALTRFFSAMVLTLLCISALSTIAKADTITFTTTLVPSEEPGVLVGNPTGSGTATVTLDDVTGKGTITVSFSGLTTPVTGGHIHCCVGRGANAGVIVPFDAFLTLSADGRSGSITNFAFTLAPVGSLTVAQQIAGMKSGLSYVNIHTTNNRGGEIRGQLNAVPEPGTLLLLGAGLVSVASRLRKRRNPDES